MNAQDWAEAVAWGVGCAVLGSAVVRLAGGHPDLAAIVVAMAVLTAKWFGRKQALRAVRKYIDARIAAERSRV